jgi:hypothetical protein
MATYTHKTKDGQLARILTTDLKTPHGGQPVLAAIVKPYGYETLHSYTSDLKFYTDGRDSAMDLVECSPWDDVAVDTKVLVRNHGCNAWCNRYFAKYENGKVYAFDSGGTSWSSDGDMVAWDQAKLAE